MYSEAIRCQRRKEGLNRASQKRLELHIHHGRNNEHRKHHSKCHMRQHRLHENEFFQNEP